MTVKVYREDGKIDEYPNAHLTWEWDDKKDELGTDSGWHIDAIYKNGVTASAFVYPRDCKKIEITHEESDKVYEPKPATPLSKGALRIQAERMRQIKEEGFTEEHDDEHDSGQLAIAAACYVLSKAYISGAVKFNFVELLWPWERKWWSPTPKNRIRELEKAGALVAAEIDRLLRQKGKNDKDSD
jgi:hypothetical protein